MTPQKLFFLAFSVFAISFVLPTYMDESHQVQLGYSAFGYAVITCTFMMLAFGPLSQSLTLVNVFALLTAANLHKNGRVSPGLANFFGVLALSPLAVLFFQDVHLYVGYYAWAASLLVMALSVRYLPRQR